MSGAPSALPIALVEALAALSEVDLPYADVYLDRAEHLLSDLWPREAYLRLCRDRDDLPHLAGLLRQATEGGDWARVHGLAEDAASKQQRLVTQRRIFEIADAVYGPRELRVGASALALNGVVAHPTAALERERVALLESLRTLAAEDHAWRAFYRARQAHFERLEVVAEATPAVLLDEETVRRRVLTAVERGDYDEVRRLTDAAQVARGRPGRARPPSPPPGLSEALAAPLPAAALAQARAVGLSAETVPSCPAMNAYLGCCCADRATFPVAPLSESHRRPGTCTCGHPCPPEVGQPLRETLDLLLLHPFISSAGTRYLPWFGAEALLVETFPETEPDARTELLDALGLPRRRGLPRIAIEDALRSRGPRLCAMLGLEPLEFGVTCIPFDAYTRLAAAHDWGRQPQWTHLDGYQVTRELRLHALVGGDVRYGGPADLCGVQRDYDSARITARFAVLRRQRFLARSPQEIAPTGSRP